jgi:hypothetical protein
MESTKFKLIITEYTEYPGPRYCNQGEHSGEDFYHQKLNSTFYQAISNGNKLTIDLDGTAGYASSFLDEAFGNLVFDFSLDLVKPNLEIISTQEPDWKVMIMNNIINDWEKRRIKDEIPKKTVAHEEWYKYENGVFIKKKWL